MKYYGSLKFSKGLTILELLIAMAISTVVIGGTFSLLTNTKKTDRYVSGLSTTQESGSFALSFLKQEARMIGYQECASYKDLNILVPGLTDTNYKRSQLTGYEIADATWKTGMDFAAINVTAKPNTSAFSIYRMDTIGDTLANSVINTTDNIVLSGTASLGINKDDWLLITDCITADLFSVSAINNLIVEHKDASGINIPLSNLYHKDRTSVSKFSKSVYFIGDTTRNSSQGEDIYALFRAQSPNFVAQEIVSGIESMQVLYGERLANGNMRYIPANQTGTVIDWSNIVSMKIALLVTSEANVRNTNDSQTYDLLGTSIVPKSATSTGSVTHNATKQLRKVHSTTIHFRNRTL
mgnify:CR=1 FL=1